MKTKGPPNVVLRRFRQRLALSQTDFATEVGMSSVYLCQIENGWYRLGDDAALRIVDRFRDSLAEARVTLEDLLRGSESAAA